jgi:small subunit ribosomal protein S16
MLSIRLSRVGKKKAPIFRVVVQPKTRDPWAKTIAILGHYNPRSKELVVVADDVKQWIANGAECSETVWNLFLDHKLVEGKKIAKSHISGKRVKTMEKANADKQAKEDAAKAKAEAAKLAEEEAKKAAAEAAKAEAEAAKAAAEAPAPVVEEVAPEAAPETPAAE